MTATNSMAATVLRVTFAVGLSFGVAPLVGGLTTPALAQANCEWYARTALRQQQQNEEKKCGLKGEAWHADLKAHLAWCASVGPDQWKSQAQARDQQLAQCAKK